MLFGMVRGMWPRLGRRECPGSTVGVINTSGEVDTTKELCSVSVGYLRLVSFFLLVFLPIGDRAGEGFVLHVCVCGCRVEG